MYRFFIIIFLILLFSKVSFGTTTITGNTDNYKMRHGSTPDVFKGLVFRAPLQDNTGTSIVDVSPYKTHGTATGGTAWANNIGTHTGNCLYFDGINDKVDFGNPADGHLDFGTNSSFSVCLWVKGGDYLGSAFLGSIVDKGGYNFPGWILSLGTNSAKVCFIQGTGTTFYPSFGTASVFIGKFGHMAMVIDRESDNLLTYTNGNQIETTSILKGKGTVASPYALSFGSSYGSSWLINCYLSDVRIYNWALSAQEVSNIYNATK